MILKRKKQKNYSVIQYAKLCGVTVPTIRNRIEAGEIVPFKEEGYSGLLIDANKYPPLGGKVRGRKSYEN